MFDQINQQNLSDIFKAFFLRIPKPAERRFALNILKGFERADWYPQILEAVVREDGRLTFDGHMAEVQGDPVEVIQVVLMEYVTRVHEGQPPRQFGTTDALQYISDRLAAAGHGLSVRGVKKYVDEGRLTGQLFGKTRVFAQHELDKFIVDYIENPPRTGPKGPHKQKTHVF